MPQGHTEKDQGWSGAKKAEKAEHGPKMLLGFCGREWARQGRYTE